MVETENKSVTVSVELLKNLNIFSLLIFLFYLFTTIHYQ